MGVHRSYVHVDVPPPRPKTEPYNEVFNVKFSLMSQSQLNAQVVCCRSYVSWRTLHHLTYRHLIPTRRFHHLRTKVLEVRMETPIVGGAIDLQYREIHFMVEPSGSYPTPKYVQPHLKCCTHNHHPTYSRGMMCPTIVVLTCIVINGCLHVTIVTHGFRNTTTFFELFSFVKILTVHPRKELKRDFTQTTLDLNTTQHQSDLAS